jgi:hypothetical protein
VGEGTVEGRVSTKAARVALGILGLVELGIMVFIIGTVGSGSQGLPVVLQTLIGVAGTQHICSQGVGVAVVAAEGVVGCKGIAACIG